MPNDEVLFVDVVVDSSPLGCEAWLEIEAHLAHGHDLALNGLVEIVSAEDEKSASIACLVGLLARVRVYCGHERPGTRLILVRGSEFQGTATARLRALEAAQPWRVVELEGGCEEDSERAKLRGAVAARLRGRLLNRKGCIHLLNGGKLRVCDCFPAEKGEWGMVTNETVIVVRDEPRREKCRCYVNETTRHEQFELWMRRIVHREDQSLPSQILLHGEAGIGKTALAVTAASTCGAQTFFAGDELLEVEIQAAIAVASIGVPTVLVLDDLDVSCPRSSTDSTSTRNILAVIKTLRKPPPGLAIVAVTSSLTLVHPFARKAFTEWEVQKLELWHRSARIALLKRISNHEIDGSLQKAADLSVSLSGPEISAAIHAARAEGIDPLSAIARVAKIVENADDGDARQQVRWEDVAGLREAKKAIRRAVVYPRLYSEQLEALNVEPPTGVLLFGPPGVGKTLLARAAAVESEARLFILTPSNVVSDRMGVSEKIVADTFKAASASTPSLIFIDEFDSLFPSRLAVDPGQLGGSLVSTLCVAFDDLRQRQSRATRNEESHDRLGVVVLAASNRPDAIDPALLQHGRFDFAIRIDLPDDEDRREHIQLLFRKGGSPLDDGIEEWLVKRTRGFSGADIASLFNNACQATLTKDDNGHYEGERRPLRGDHFETAFAVTRTLQEEMDAAAEKEAEVSANRESRAQRGCTGATSSPVQFPIAVEHIRGSTESSSSRYYSTAALPRD